MGKRSRVISATVMAIIGVGVMVLPVIGGSSLHAAGIQSTGYDITKYLVWGGVGVLVLSALIFVSAGAD